MSQAPILVGIGGYKQSGKDTAAQALVDFRGFKRLAFADPVREVTFALHPFLRDIPYEDRDIPKLELGGRTLRSYLVEVGEGAREKDPYVWINIVLGRAKELFRRGRSVVISDLRHRNEFAAVAGAGGVRLWVSNPAARPGNDITEQARPEWADSTIHNDGAVRDLHLRTIRQVDAWVLSRKELLGYGAAPAAMAPQRELARHG